MALDEISRTATLQAGLRWDRQNAIVNLDNLYTRPGYAGVWGISLEQVAEATTANFERVFSVRLPR